MKRAEKREAMIIAILSLFVGVLYLSLIIYSLSLPSGQRYDAGYFFQSYSENTSTMNALWIIMALTSLCSVFILPYVQSKVIDSDIEVFKTLKTAMIGAYLISAASFITMVARAPQMADIYLGSENSTQKAIEAIHLPQIDPFNLIVLGIPGLWFVVVNAYALIENKLNKFHASIGVLLGLGMFMAVAAAILEVEVLDQIASGLGALLAPLWFVVFGVRYLMKRNSVS